ncbi:hypothetical protein OCU04_012221 [Sclerotinia nivalis]|uniref:Uncharacterized protein n=1 Tax=Sclerotinia nivalis TaxID=352851 RepID=A0A9X0AAK5_9HELO|nr:hypothetical protein OCU04_012221 [Sclerotinia nivalis]
MQKVLFTHPRVQGHIMNYPLAHPLRNSLEKSKLYKAELPLNFNPFNVIHHQSHQLVYRIQQGLYSCSFSLPLSTEWIKQYTHDLPDLKPEYLFYDSGSFS